MRLFRIITALMVGLAVASLPSAPGAAQPAYPPGPPVLTASDTTVAVGEPIVLTGENFEPGEIIDITVTTTPLAARAPGAATDRARTSTVAMAMVPVAQRLPARAQTTFQVVADAEGNFEFRYTPRYPGVYTITAVGRESGLRASVTVTVLGGPQLPVTGGDIGPQLAIGSGLLVAGILLVLMAMAWRQRSRRRRLAPEYETAC